MLPLVSVVGVVTILHSHSLLPEENPKALAFTIRCLGVALWPLVIRSLCADCRHVLAGTLWMFLLEVLDAVVLLDPESTRGLTMEKGSFLGIVFALAALSGNRPDATHSQLFVYSILGMFLTVVPSHDLKEGSRNALLLENVQRVILHYCVALFVTAISLTRSSKECRAS